MTQSQYPVNETNQVKRVPKRGHYDHATVHAIIDSALICHMGITMPDGNVSVIPMFHARVENRVVVHGATKSRLMQALVNGKQVCMCFAMVDGLVLAKSLFHHSMNYRSVVAYGTGTLVESDEHKLSVLRSMTDKIMPGRWDDARAPSTQELKATAVVELEIEIASAKVRTGAPVDDPEDESLPYWAGVVPFRHAVDTPIPGGGPETELPPYIERYLAQQADVSSHPGN